MSTEKNALQEIPATISTGGEVWLDENGLLTSRNSQTEVTEELAEAIMEENSPRFREFTGKYLTTDDLIEELLTKDKRRESGNPLNHGDDGAEEAPKESDRPFVGVNLDNKIKPRITQKQGKDPLHMRQFIGDEFPRMLAYGPPVFEDKVITTPEGHRKIERTLLKPGRPAFYSHWPEGTKLEDMKVIKINIATRVPKYMTEGTIAASMEARKKFAFSGQTLEEAFNPITDKVEKVLRAYAKDFERTFGIRLDVRRDDSDEPHPADEVNLSVMSFARGNPQLLGFASFPEEVNKWPVLRTLGHKQGFMMLNHEYMNNSLVDERAIYDLIFHEMGHFFGMVHPHDLGAMHMTQAEAFNSTSMAYTDGKFCKFPDQEGAICGAVDMYFRNYMHNPPELNTEHGTVYDLEEQYKRSLGENGDSIIMARTGMIPTVPIVNNGTGTVLRGSGNDDIIDTEPGHISFRKNHVGTKQGYALVEGHISKVYGRAGNNDIFTSSKGSQEIHPGIGRNRIHIYSPQIGDTKTIYSQGRDMLLLHQDLMLANTRMKVEQDGDDIIFVGEKGRIVLKDQLKKDQGVASIGIINDEGRMVMQQNVEFFDLTAFNKDFLEPMKRHAKRIVSAQKQATETKEQENTRVLTPAAPDHEEHQPAFVSNDNEAPAPAPGAVGSYLERLKQERSAKAAGNGTPGRKLG